MKRPAVLMTDPEHYMVKFGENPHTRSADGHLKVVDRSAARRQWERYTDTLRDHGVDVYVTHSAPDLTGMVFAANAGFLVGRLADVPTRQKRFYPSHFMVPHRKPEAKLFKRFMYDFGFSVADYDDTLRFEGEADGFPVGTRAEPDWVFTYGFRSDPEAGKWLEEITEEQFLRVELTDPRFYHGDCLVCDLGDPLLAWLGGMDDAGRERFAARFGDRIVEMSDEDALKFVGNSFYVTVDDQPLLFATAEIGADIRARIEERGVTVVTVDISEFFGKGGGGPKCMVFNLGLVDPTEEEASDEARRFRVRHRLT